MLVLTKKLYKLLNYCLMIGISIVLTIVLTSCACNNKKDPLERLNRGIFFVNKTVDTLYLKPIACAYEKFLPKPYRCAVHSFVKNLRTLPTIANDILQCKFKMARYATARFIINSTWGIGGLLDVASWANMEEHQNDFGLTLAHYGFTNSFYVVLPLAGPSTFCDSIGRGVDAFINVWPYIKPSGLGWGLYGLYLIDTRVGLLVADPLIAEAAVDEYTFVREAYLQHRYHQLKMNEGIDCETEISVTPDLESPYDDIDNPKEDDEDEDSDSDELDEKDVQEENEDEDDRNSKKNKDDNKVRQR